MQSTKIFVFISFLLCLSVIDTIAYKDVCYFTGEEDSRTSLVIHSDAEEELAIADGTDRSFDGDILFTSEVTKIEGRWSHAHAITIEEGVEMLGISAFQGSKADILIPMSVKVIEGTFNKAEGNISVKNGNPIYKSIDGMLIETGTKTLIHINHDQKKVIIPKEAEHVGALACAFNETIESVEMPFMVESIDFMAFADCTNLRSVQLSEGLREVYGEVFINCPIEQLVLPAHVQFMDDSEDTGSFLGGETGAKSLVIMGNETNIRYQEFGGWKNDTLQYVAFAKEPPEEFDSAVFKKYYSESFVLYYLNEYRSFWSPTGETEWDGVPIVGIDSLDDLPPVE